MASEVRRTGAALTTRSPDVGELLLEAPYKFDFFQAVRLLERVYPGRRPVGGHEPPGEEVVRFHAHNTLAFPASEVQDITSPSESGAATGPAHMWVNFMGLTGSQGALPRHYTSLLSDATARAEVAPLREFLDIFNHRFISLFYRAWEKYRFPIAYERGQGDRFSQYLFCIIGMGTAGLQQRLSFTDEILLYYSGLLSQRPRSAIALQSLLEDYFEVPVRVEQFTGQWFLMNPDILTGLGNQNHQLGVTTVLWQRIFDPQARFRVVVGPLPYRQFRDFLPNAMGYGRLLELTRFFVGDDLNFEVRPLVDPADIPACALGADPSQRLGWSMWLTTEGADDSVTQPLFEARVATRIDLEAATT